MKGSRCNGLACHPGGQGGYQHFLVLESYYRNLDTLKGSGHVSLVAYVSFGPIPIMASFYKLFTLMSEKKKQHSNQQKVKE